MHRKIDGKCKFGLDIKTNTELRVRANGEDILRKLRGFGKTVKIFEITY